MKAQIKFNCLALIFPFIRPIDKNKIIKSKISPVRN
jgi:hypothetical protein